MFDQIYIAILNHPKKRSLFTVEERITHIQRVLDNESRVSIEGFDGLLIDFAQKKQAFTIIRGIRALSDFDYEFQMALMNRKLNNKVDSVFFMTDEKYSYLSSSTIKEVIQLGGRVKDLVPTYIEDALIEKLKGNLNNE